MTRRFLPFVALMALLLAGGAEAQEIVPLETSTVVLGWSGSDYLKNGDRLDVWIILRTSVEVFLETGEQVTMCALGGVVIDKDTGQTMQYQTSIACWWSASDNRWEAASTWLRWSPTGIVYETQKALGSFDPETGKLQQDGAAPFWLVPFNP